MAFAPRNSKPPGQSRSLPKLAEPTLPPLRAAGSGRRQPRGGQGTGGSCMRVRVLVDRALPEGRPCHLDVFNGARSVLIGSGRIPCCRGRPRTSRRAAGCGAGAEPLGVINRHLSNGNPGQRRRPRADAADAADHGRFARAAALDLRHAFRPRAGRMVTPPADGCGGAALWLVLLRPRPQRRPGRGGG